MKFEKVQSCVEFLALQCGPRYCSVNQLQRARKTYSMKRSLRPAKKRILVALLGMCVVSSSYIPGLASQTQTVTPPATVQSVSTPSPNAVAPPVTTTPSGPNKPQDVWWFSPFWPVYFDYYCY